MLQTNAGNTDREKLGEIFAQEAQAVGIDVDFQPVDFNVVVTSLMDTYEWDATLIGLTVSVDPIGGVNVYPSTGPLHMIHPSQETPLRDWEARVDAAWDTANNTLDEDQRKEGWEEIQRIWIEELPWIYTTTPAIVYPVSTDYGNVKPRDVLDGIHGILHYLYQK